MRVCAGVRGVNQGFPGARGFPISDAVSSEIVVPVVPAGSSVSGEALQHLEWIQ